LITIRKKFYLLLATSILFNGCGDIELENCACDSNDNIDSQLNNIIVKNKLTGDALKHKQIPDISSPKAQLGMDLFFSKSLGADRDSACVTCHHPLLGGGDKLSLPIGTGAVTVNLLGKGRLHDSQASHYDGGPTVPRNAPTTFNMAAWNKVLFYDGRVEHLNPDDISTPDSTHNVKDDLATDNLASAQSRFPITSPEEMKGFNHQDKDNYEIREYVASRIGGYAEGTGELNNTSYWLTKFQSAFEKPNISATELVTEQNIALLIGEYENSQAFTNTPWKEYVEGNLNAISNDAKKGALLFFNDNSKGGVNCVSCHSGDFFTDEGFHNIAMPQLGRGKGHGDELIEDLGRVAVTGDETDKYKFRTPSLVNTEVTGPWGHAGAYTSLKAVIKHHLNPKKAIENYDFSQLTQTGIQNLDSLKQNTNKAIKVLEEDQKNGLDTLQYATLTEVQINQLISFITSLTDPCVLNKECLSQWIPKPQQDPNGDQLDAIDNKGNILRLVI